MLTVQQIHRARDAHNAELAHLMGTYADDEVVRQRTVEIMSAGQHVLQIFWLDRDEVEHVKRLLGLFSLPEGAQVLDAGCGIGAVAFVMAAVRPDLNFTLLNISQAQLEMCPHRFKCVQADFHHMPLPDASFDAVMMNYSLGHGCLYDVLAEANRVLKPGGSALIYDMAGDDGDKVLATLAYQIHPMRRLLQAADESGFDVALELKLNPGHVDHFYQFMSPAEFRQVFAGVHGIALRLVKR
jgi:ubiquinone/menaquinone biosynthesis C-methylase UbiE